MSYPKLYTLTICSFYLTVRHQEEVVGLAQKMNCLFYKHEPGSAVWRLKKLLFYARHPSRYPVAFCLWLQALEDKFPVSVTQWPLPRHVQLWRLLRCFSDLLAQIPTDSFDCFNYFTWQSRPVFLFACVDIEGLLVVLPSKKSPLNRLLSAISNLAQRSFILPTGNQ